MSQEPKSRLEVESLEPRMMLSSVQIYAAGDTGTESFELLINDQVQATFTDVGGDFDNRDFVRLEFQTTENITGGDVKIRFINDDYRPADGFDSNLHVSRIVVDGVVYETEDPSTFSTGYWTDGGFTGPGFFQNETLNANGTFAYSDNGLSSGTRIKIDARGNTGEEIMQLRIDGNVVKQFAVTQTDEAGIFVYQTDESVTVDQIQIAFVNDQYDPAQGIDRNLTIERLRLVDRSTAETETYFADSSSTFSTGTWTPQDGIVDGFGRGDTLNGNGFFQFAGSIDSGPLDTSFGDNGFASFNQRGSDPLLRISSNGLIVTGSSTETGRDTGFSEIHVFDANGNRMTSFGNNGYLRIESPNLDSISVLQDGSLLIGNRFIQSMRMDVTKIGANGVIDSSFGDNGIKQFNGLLSSFVAATPDGGFLLAAKRTQTGTPNMVERYDVFGNKDFSYGNNGVANLPTDFTTREIQFLDWGAAVLNGGTQVVQITPAGWLDQGFGNNGVADSPFLIDSLEIDSQNRIVAQGRTLGQNSTSEQIRFTNSGQIDSSFNQNPIWINADGFVELGAFTVDSSDRIVGSFVTSKNIGNGEFEFTRTLYRLNANGTADTSFGNGGVLVEDVSSDSSFVPFETKFHSIELNSSGQAIAATIFGLRRYNL